VEARELNLEQLLDQLKIKNKKLEDTLHRVQMLESIQSHMSKFVPRSVQNLIKDNPENPDLNKHEKNISVLFLDIAGYTKMSENNSRKKLNYLIETYFSEFLNIIVENNGDINETAGDGLMILFQDATPQTHAMNAVCAAVGIHKQTMLINESLLIYHWFLLHSIIPLKGLCQIGTIKPIYLAAKKQSKYQEHKTKSP